MPTNDERRTRNICLGISSYTYGWAVGVRGHEPPRPMDEHGLLDKALEHGVKLLQIGDNLPLHTFDDARIDRLAGRARRDGVRLEVGGRGLRVEQVTAYASVARRLGATLIRFIIDDSGYHPSPGEVSAVLREVTPLLNGLTLGIENHDRFNAGTLRTIVESAGTDRVGICLDTSNSLGSGEGIEAVAAVLAPYTVNLHVKDFGIERLPYLMGFTITGRPAGGGMLDLPGLLSQLAPYGKCATAILELWTPPEPRIDDTINKEAVWATQSLAYLRRLFSSSDTY